MKNLLLILFLFISFNAFGQIESAPPPASSTEDTTVYTKWPNSSYGIKLLRMYPTRVLRTPKDTIYSKAGLAILDTMLWYGDEVRWRRSGDATSGAEGTVTSFSSGNLAPLFTTSVATATTTPALSFTLSNTSQYTVLGRSAAGSGVPSYISIDTTFISNFHVKVRSLFSVGTGLTYNSATGAFGVVDQSATNELQTLSTSGTTTPTVTLSNSGGSFSITGAGIAVLSRSGDAFTITATEVDGSVTNEIQDVSLSGTTTVSIATEETITWTLTGAGIAVVSRSGNDVTVTATEVDGSTSNELQTLSTSGTTTPTVTLSNSGGSFSITGAGIAVLSRSGDAFTVTATEVDGSITNEIQTISVSGTTTVSVALSNSGGTWTITGAGIAAISRSGNDITVTATEVYLGTVTSFAATDGNGFDFSVANATTTPTLTATTTVGDTRVFFSTSGAMTGDGDMVYNSTSNILTVPVVKLGSGNPEIQATSNNDILLTAHNTTDLDLLQFGGTTNEHGAIGFNNGSDPDAVAELYIFKADDSGFGDLSTGGFGNFIISLNADDTLTNGVHTVFVNAIDSNIIVTLPDEALNGGQEYRIKKTDESSDTVFVRSVTDPDVNWATLTIQNEVVLLQADSSAPAWVRVNNELSSGGVTTVTASGLLTSSGGSTPNISSSMSQGKLVGRGSASGTGIFQEITISSGLTLTGTTLTAVDQSETNEVEVFNGENNGGDLRVKLSPANTSWLDISDGAGISLSLNVTLSNRPGVTISANDDSPTNEIQTLSGSGTTTPTITLSDGGGAFSITGAGIAVASRSGTDITITATEVDGSTSNELQTITNSSAAGSHTITLSNSGGSTQFIAGTGISFTTGGSGSAGTLTIATAKVLNDGVYTSTLTDAENVGGSTAYEGQWLQVGSTVTYSFTVDITWSSVSTFTRLGFSLPVASGFNTGFYHLAGTAVTPDDPDETSMALRQDATNNRGEIVGYSPASGESAKYHVHCTYRIVTEN